MSFIIDDDYDVRPLLDLNRGMEGFYRNGFANPLMGNAVPFDESLLIPRSEWRGMIEERKARRQGLRFLALDRGLTVLNQERTNYCWANGPTFAIMLHILKNHNKVVRLSPASVAAQIKNYQNVGGWGDEALAFIQDNGIAPQSLWPPNAIDPKYNTVTTQQQMRDYMIHRWLNLQPKNHDQMISLLLRDIPVPAGFLWWGHLICGCDVDWINGDAAPVFANSYGEVWGDRGYVTLEGSRKLSDGACAPLSILNA